MPFGKMCPRTEVDDEPLCDLHGGCHPGGGNTSGEAPRRMSLSTQPGEDPTSLVPVPFLEPGQSPHPVSMGGLVLATMEATLLKQVHEIKEQIRGFHELWDCLAQEEERAEKEREQISNWVGGLLDEI